jgi:hypothetical protein
MKVGGEYYMKVVEEKELFPAREKELVRMRLIGMCGTERRLDH